MAGAGLLAAQGALYAGAGKISLFTPQSPAEELTGLLPEIMVRPASTYGEFREEDVEDVLYGTDACDVLAIGPGLGRKQETQDFVCQVLEESEGPIIVDADALYAVGAKKFPLRSCGGQLPCADRAWTYGKAPFLAYISMVWLGIYRQKDILWDSLHQMLREPFRQPGRDCWARINFRGVNQL